MNVAVSEISTLQGPDGGARLLRGAAAVRRSPADVVEKAKICFRDALACCLFGVTQPWTRMLIHQAMEEGGNPRAGVIGSTLRTSIGQAVCDRRDRGARFRARRHPRRRASPRRLARGAGGARARRARPGVLGRAHHRGDGGGLRGRPARRPRRDRRAVHARTPFPGDLRGVRRGGDGGQHDAALRLARPSTPSASPARSPPG